MAKFVCTKRYIGKKGLVKPGDVVEAEKAPSSHFEKFSGEKHLEVATPKKEKQGDKK